MVGSYQAAAEHPHGGAFDFQVAHALSSWHALGEFLDEGFIFLLTAGQIGWYFIDHRSINFLKGVSAAMNYLRMFNQSALGAPEIVAKGTEMRSVLLGTP